MSKEWLKRIDEVRQRARILESVPGSGFHDNDRNSITGEYCSPQRKGKCRLSENPVAFHDERDVHFIGEDAERVAKAIEEYAKKIAALPMDSLEGSQRQILARVKARRLRIHEVDGAPRLTLWMQEWNDWLYAIEECGIGITGLPANE